MKNFVKMISVKSYVLVSVVVFFVLVESIINPYTLKCYQLLINYASESSIDYTLILYSVVLYKVTQLVTCITKNINGYIKTKLGYSLSSDTTEQIFKKLSIVKVEEFENPNIYNLLDRINRNMSNGALNLIDILISVIGKLIQIVGYGFIIYNIHNWFLFIIVGISIPILIWNMRCSKLNYQLERNINTYNRKITYLQDLFFSRESIKDIKLYKLQNYFNTKARELRNIVNIKKIDLEKKIAIYSNIIMLIKYLIIGFCLYRTYYLVIDGAQGIGSLIVLFFAFQNIENSLLEAYQYITVLKDFRFVLDDLNEFYSLEEEHAKCSCEKSNYEIKIAKLYYKYPGSNVYVLKNLNLYFHQNEKIAIVGNNGSGKSTFINIISGSYQNYEGKVFIGKNDLKNCLESYRSIISCMFQDYIKYNLSIKENIRLDKKYLNLDFLEETLKLSKVVNKFDKKYETILGQLDPGGLELSGGQWLLLAIARCISVPNSNILIFDEPTANLDSQFEDIFNNSFKVISNNKTCFICTHRLSTALLCDRVLVFDNGMIVEDGNPRFLLKNQGIFYRMFNAQREFYT